MSAQLGSAIVLNYGGQGARQSGGSVLLSYTPPAGVRRVTSSVTGAPWGKSTGDDVGTNAGYPTAHLKVVDTGSEWGASELQRTATGHKWVKSHQIDIQENNEWGSFSQRLYMVQSSLWVVSHSRDTERQSLWGQYGYRPQPESASHWVVSHARDHERTSPWGGPMSVLRYALESLFPASKSLSIESKLPWRFYSRPMNPGWGVPNPPGGIGEDEANVIVPIQRVYIVLNSASLRRVDGNIYLPTFGMSLSLDTSSWTWGFSATLPGSTLASLEPSSEGAPVEVEAMINGVAYRALVEGVSRNRSFGKSDISIRGRGKTSLLDAPYAPVQSFTNTIARTAAQLMDDVLMVNGVAMGWAVDFALDDWLVPAGVFSHQGSYISALNAIAGAAGGYVQPHATGQSLRVLPKYPSGPWDWASVTPDYELPSAVTTTESIEWVEKARYNRVYVSGVQQGILGEITRAGTAGDLAAQMVTDQLITATAAARQRGLSVLADTGRIASVKLRLPVLAETGIITPGKFVKYTDAGTNRLGLVRSVNVDVGMPEIFQSIEVETHV